LADSNTGIAPPGYHQHYYSDRSWNAYSEILSLIVKNSQPGPILDLGAGCGYLVEAVGRWGWAGVGLEGSQEAIDMANRRLSGLDLRLHRLSEALPFAENSFQTVVLNQVIEHLEPEVMKQALREVKRVLIPGGMLLITSPSRFNRKEWKADPTHINLLSPTQLRGELSACGFEYIKPFDSPLHWLGKNWVGIGIVFVLFNLLKLDVMSATANAFAYKPKPSEKSA
jgi:SAM-dependent methyltransferase